jgi:hypothetical protein
VAESARPGRTRSIRPYPTYRTHDGSVECCDIVSLLFSSVYDCKYYSATLVNSSPASLAVWSKLYGARQCFIILWLSKLGSSLKVVFDLFDIWYLCVRSPSKSSLDQFTLLIILQSCSQKLTRNFHIGLRL